MTVSIADIVDRKLVIVSVTKVIVRFVATIHTMSFVLFVWSLFTIVLYGYHIFMRSALHWSYNQVLIKENYKNQRQLKIV